MTSLRPDEMPWRESAYGGLEVAPQRISYAINEKLALDAATATQRTSYSVNEKQVLKVREEQESVSTYTRDEKHDDAAIPSGLGAPAPSLNHFRRRSQSSTLATDPVVPAYVLVDAHGHQQALYTNAQDAASLQNFDPSSVTLRTIDTVNVGLRRADTVTTLASPDDNATLRNVSSWGTEADVLMKEKGGGGFTVPPPPLEKRILGLKKKSFRNLVLISLALILIVMGVLLGYFFGVRAIETDSDDVSVPAEADSKSALLSSSKLAAMNWTDSDGTDFSAVVYQHSSNALMLSTKSSLTNTWSTMNLTQNVMNATNSDNLAVLPGTPLACTNNRGLWNLYYLTPSNTIAELYSTNPTKQWLKGEFGSKIGAKALEGSRLAAVTQICSKCSNSLLVLWQDTAGTVQLANYTNGNWQQGPTVAETAASGTGLALAAFTDFQGNSSSGTDANALRVYHASGSNLVETKMGPESKFQWQTGNNGQPVWEGLPTNPSPQVACITFGQHGWDNSLVTLVDSKGNLVSNLWMGDGWSTKGPSLLGGPENVTTFSALATTQKMRTYGLSNGAVHEFITNQSNPFSWTWEGTVG